MSRRVEWLGIRLPMSHPVIAYMYGRLSKQERDALMAVEACGVNMMVIPRVTAFRIGPPQGFSKWYHFGWQNRYTEVMEQGDAARLFRGAIVEYETFRDPDYPPHANKKATYPSLAMMSNMRMQDTSRGRTMWVTKEQARIVHNLLRRADKLPAPVTLINEHGRYGQLTPTAISLLRTTKGKVRR